jgi:SAM-dependent methyltransferase
MVGDFQTKSNEFKAFLVENSVTPSSNGIAIDLGAGHGLQSIALAEVGFQVVAVDFNQQLLDELKVNSKDLGITVLNDDIRKVAVFAGRPELIICCGDTLTHLENKSETKAFIEDIVKSLGDTGKLILSFRDYSTKLTGTDRFIPVKSDDNRILTCILDYDEESVNVTDLLQKKVGNALKQKVSTCKKVRLSTNEVIGYLKSSGMKVSFNKILNRLTTVMATKG